MLKEFLQGDDMKWRHLCQPNGLLARLRAHIQAGEVDSIRRIREDLDSSRVKNGILKCCHLLDEAAGGRIHGHAKLLADVAHHVATGRRVEQQWSDPQAATKEIWERYFRNDFPAAPAVSAPLAGAMGEIGFLSDLSLFRLVGLAAPAALVPHPEIALLPFGSDLVECLQQQWRARAGNLSACWCITHREIPGGVREQQLSGLLMDGGSLGAPAAALFFYFREGRRFDPKCVITASVDPEDGTLRPVGSEVQKYRAAAAAGMNRFGLAQNPLRQRLGQYGGLGCLVNDELRTVDDAIAFADERWIPREPRRRAATEGVAVLLPPLGTTPARVAPVSVCLRSGIAPSAQFVPSQPTLDAVADSALGWAGSYARKFSGTLGAILQEECLGVNRGANSALFEMPDAPRQHPDLIRAPLALAVIDAMLRLVLDQRFRLAPPSLDALLLCAAGFEQFTRHACGVEGSISSLDGQTFAKRVTLLHARDQQPDVQALSVSQLKPVPMDHAEDFVSELLFEWIEVLKTRLASALADRVRGVLRDVIKLEHQLEEARRARMDRATRHARLRDELMLSKAAQDLLDEFVKRVREHAGPADELPTVEQLAEKFADQVRQWKEDLEVKRRAADPDERPEVIAFVHRPDPDGEDASESQRRECRRLYRLVAAGLHPDSRHQDPEFLEWFHEVVKHQEDRPYVGAMFAVVHKLDRVPLSGGVQDRISRYFDQIAASCDAEQALRKRLDDMRAELDSYGVVQRVNDEEEEKMEQLTDILEKAINNRFRQLSWLLRGDF